MFRIAICDDEAMICGQIEQILQRHYKEIELEIFHSGEELLACFASGYRFDLIFLDIQLPAIDGIELGRSVREEIGDEATAIVYISSQQSYAMELFANRPLHFLIKPLDEARIMSCANKAMALAQRNNLFFEFSIGNEFHKIPYKEILYFESYYKKVRIITTGEVFEFYGRLRDIQPNLPQDFIEIHKSYLVNYLYIAQSHYNSLCLTTGQGLHISQGFRKEVRDFLLRRRRIGGA